MIIRAMVSRPSCTGPVATRSASGSPAIAWACWSKKRTALEHDIARLNERIEAAEGEFRDQQARSDHIRQAIRDNGGDRLEQIRRDIASEQRRRDERKGRW